jgi:hypothetical protein
MGLVLRPSIAGLHADAGAGRGRPAFIDGHACSSDVRLARWFCRHVGVGAHARQDER